MSQFPHSWQALNIGASGTWLSGGTPSTTNPEYWHGDIPWISSGSLTNFRLWDSDRRVTSVGANNGTRIVKAGTILMVVRGMSLKTEFRLGIAQREMAFGQDCKALVAREDIDPEFLAYSIAASSNHILSIVDEAGHGTGRLNSDQLYAVEIGVPPLAEQRAIAEVLGALDDKIAANTQLASTAADLMVTLLSDYPPTVPLSEVIDHKRASVNPQTMSAETVAHFSLPAFDSDGMHDVCQPSEIMSNKFLIEQPSVLISKLNPRFPRIWNLEKLPEIPAIASTEFLVLEPKEETTAVIWAMLSQPSFSASLQSQVSGTSSSHQRVKPADLMETFVPAPNAIPVVVKKQVTTLGSIASSTRAENLTLAAIRDALLPQLMSGKLRAKDAEAIIST